MLMAENKAREQRNNGLSYKLDLDDIKKLHSNGEYNRAIQKYAPIVKQLKKEDIKEEDKKRIAKFLHYFASVNYRAGNIEEAVKYGEMSVDLNNNDPEVLLDFGTYYWRFDQKNWKKSS